MVTLEVRLRVRVRVRVAATHRRPSPCGATVCKVQDSGRRGLSASFPLVRTLACGLAHCRHAYTGHIETWVVEVGVG